MKHSKNKRNSGGEKGGMGLMTRLVLNHLGVKEINNEQG
jgi:hypothetical protein